MRKMFVALVAAGMVSGAAHGADLRLTNSQVLTMDSGPTYEVRDIVVREGKFTSSNASQDAQTIDLTGMYVIPGLAEMHAHVPVPRMDSPGYREDVLFLWVANGVTRARGMMGHPSHLELREAIAAHEVLGPALTISGPSFSGGSVRDVASAEQRVRDQKAAGYDFLKIHPGLSAAAFEAVARTANEAGIAFAGHVTGAVGLLDSLKAKQQTIDHLDGFVETLVAPARLADRQASWFGADLVMDVDSDRIPTLIEALTASGAAVVPTETLLENVAGDLAESQAREEYAYLPENLRRSYSRAVAGSARAFTPESAARFLSLRKRLIGAAHDAGVPILLGSDSPQIFNTPGFSIHRELGAMVASGLTPYEAIASGSTVPAEFFGESETWGGILPGREADLIVLRDDPLIDIDNARSIEAVMVRGRYLAREELDAGLADIRARYE